MTAAPSDGASGRRTLWSWVVGGVLAAVLLWYSLRGIDWRRVGEILRSARWQFLAGFCGTMCVSFFLRAVRWRILLNATERLSVGAVFWANMAGYLGNSFLPARAGEVLRSVLISRQSSLSKAYVLTTALAERLADVIALVLWSSLVLLGMPSKPRWIEDLSRTTALIAAAGAVVIAVLPHLGGVVDRVLGRVPLPARFRQPVLELAQQTLLGLRAFHHWGRFAGFAGFTVLIWVCDAVGTMLAASSLGLELPFSVAMLLLTGFGLGSALPSTPGYVGIFQFVAVTVLAPFGIARDGALALSVVIQALQYTVVAALGMPGLAKGRAAAR